MTLPRAICLLATALSVICTLAALARASNVQQRAPHPYRPPGAGYYKLRCPVGWRWDGRRCTDIDECAAVRHECRSPRVACLNTLGSYRCVCLAGFTGDHYTVGCKTEEEYCRTVV